MAENFSQKILAVCKRLSERQAEFSTTEISDAAGIQTMKDHQRMLDALSDHYKFGKLQRVRLGVYTLIERRLPPQIQEKMWRIFRARRVVTVEDMMELAGATEEYALEFLRMLVQREVAKKIDSRKYQLVKDTVELPRNERKAEKLRRFRARQNAVRDGIDQAQAAVLQANSALDLARKALLEIGDE